MTEALVREWVDRFSEQLHGQIPSVQTPEQVLENLPTRIQQLQSVADSIYDRWIEILP